MLFLASVVTKATNLMNLSVLLFLPIMALLIATNRCPHCGKYFRGVYWAKEAGTCQKCGMRLYFDDEMGEYQLPPCCSVSAESSERKTLSLLDSAVVVQDLKSPQSIRLRTFLMP